MAHEHCHCRNYTRSALLREAGTKAAQAGQGLPAIETGMPVPAGTGLSRRSLLVRGTGLALAVYGATRLPLRALQEGIAQAATPDKVLVSLFFDGGIDALNVLAPINNSTYQQLRPTLALQSGLPFSQDSTLFWHPSAAKLKTLHEEGKVSVLPAIGYDDPDQSHFTSRHFYEIGETRVGANTGWLGRYVEAVGDDDNPLQGISLDGDLSPMLATPTKPVAAIESVSNYDMWSWAGDVDQIETSMFNVFRGFGELGANSAAMSQARRTTYQTARLREQLSQFGDYTPPVAYPADNYLGDRLSGLAALLSAGMPIRCATVSAAGGYDTHSNQAQDLQDNLLDTCEAVYSFQRDLEARGLADRVMLEMWSEFGRRPEENDGGTDHGAAGIAFVVGSKAKGQVVGAPPSLSSLDQDDNLVHNTDFRGMYVSLLDQWLGVDPGPIIPGADTFPVYDLVKP
jgi:uncharacterized protein (DUF1501 family)